MKLNYRKICRRNEGVSEVIGGLLLITIVVSFMSSLMWISTTYMDMQKNVVNANVEACQKFIDYLNSLFPPTPENGLPEILYPSPGPYQTGVQIPVTCRVLVCDEDSPKLYVTFFFYGTAGYDASADLSSSQQPSQLVKNNTIVEQLYKSADQPGTDYYWQVSVSDGKNFVKSDVYKFTTVAVGTPGQPPVILSTYPANNAVGIVPPVTCEVTIRDLDSATVDVYYTFNPPGFGGADPIEVTINPFTHVGVFQYYNRWATDPQLDYQWSVMIIDGPFSLDSGLLTFHLSGWSPPTI